MTVQENQITIEMLNAFTSELLTARCNNYGYDYRDFKRISSQRSKARKALLNQVSSFGFESIKANLVQEARIQFMRFKIIDGNKIPTFERGICYMVGQSSNEEITNLMRRLVNSQSKWVK
jgi:hypothetical protein